MMFTVACALLMAGMVSAQTYVTGSSGQTQNFEGYIADRLCVDKRRALDGADMLLAPEQHTVHCMVDIQSCIDSGFCLLGRNPATLHYGCVYNFTAADTAKFVTFMRRFNSNNRKVTPITFAGTWTSSSALAVNDATIRWSGAVGSAVSLCVALIVVLTVVTIF